MRQGGLTRVDRIQVERRRTRCVVGIQAIAGGRAHALPGRGRREVGHWEQLAALRQLLQARRDGGQLLARDEVGGQQAADVGQGRLHVLAAFGGKMGFSGHAVLQRGSYRQTQRVEGQIACDGVRLAVAHGGA
ncbi:hypothetical protein D3C85_1389930 [compost metagenome]